MPKQIVKQINMRKVLVLAPHTDDAELGCGGTIARLLEENAKVYIAVFSTAEESLPEDVPKDTLVKEFFKASSVLGVPESNLVIHNYSVRRLSYHRQEVLEEIIRLRDRINPDLVLLPSQQDVHQDHQVVHIEGVRAFRNTSVLGYELPWNQTFFTAQSFILLKKSHVEKKWAALEMYNSQISLKRPYFTREYIKGLAKIRGAQISEDWAEAFEVLRIIF